MRPTRWRRSTHVVIGVAVLALVVSLLILLIGSVMYRTRLVPRWIPTLGLIGAPLLLLSTAATLFGAWDQISAPAAVLTLPIAVWEFAFGVYMTVKGFRRTGVDAASADGDIPRLAGAAA